MVGLYIGHRIWARGRQKEKRTPAGERREKGTMSEKRIEHIDKTHTEIDAAKPSVWSP